MKIEELHLENFKTFTKASLSFSKITLLTGANSSGKSSILNALASIMQADSEQPFPFQFSNYGQHVQLGGFKDIIHSGDKNKKFLLKIKLSHNTDTASLTGKFRYAKDGSLITLDSAQIETKYGIAHIKWNNEVGYSARQTGDRSLAKRESEMLEEVIYSTKSITNHISNSQADEELESFKKFIARMNSTSQKYESLNEKDAFLAMRKFKSDARYFTSNNEALRFTSGLNEHSFYIGPVRAYPYRQYQLRTFSKKIDSKGENAYQIIYNWKKHNQKCYTKLINDLAYIGLAASLSAEALKDDLIEISVKTPNQKTTVNIGDVGFGIPQVLPILIACNQASSDDSILINQPEVHLHPSAQAMLGNYFANESKTKNFIIETHSEYLINRLRLLTAKGEFSSTDVKIYYMHTEGGKTKLHEIEINQNGELVGAPDSFFETYYIDNKELLMTGF